jgi:hypothetical protein
MSLRQLGLPRRPRSGRRGGHLLRAAFNSRGCSRWLRAMVRLRQPGGTQRHQYRTPQRQTQRCWTLSSIPKTASCLSPDTEPVLEIPAARRAGGPQASLGQYVGASLIPPCRWPGSYAKSALPPTFGQLGWQPTGPTFRMSRIQFGMNFGRLLRPKGLLRDAE